MVVLTILKNMKVNGKDDIPYIMEIKFRFETTNQYIYIYAIYFMMNPLKGPMFSVKGDGNWITLL